jgi:hypothetical protein
MPGIACAEAFVSVAPKPNTRMAQLDKVCCLIEISPVFLKPRVYAASLTGSAVFCYPPPQRQIFILV